MDQDALPLNHPDSLSVHLLQVQASAGVSACYWIDHLLARFPQKMNVPRFVDVTMSITPSLLRSAANTVDPTPERLWIYSGLNSAPPGALGLRTVRNQYKTAGPNGSGSV